MDTPITISDSNKPSNRRPLFSREGLPSNHALVFAVPIGVIQEIGR